MALWFVEIAGVVVYSQNERERNMHAESRKQAAQARTMLIDVMQKAKPKGVKRLRFTRISPRPLDDDNPNWKYLKDEFCAWLRPDLVTVYIPTKGPNKGKVIQNKGHCDKGIKSRYEQERGPVGIRIEVLA